MTEHPQSQPMYLTPTEVAGLYRVDPSTVRRWAKDGKLHPTKTIGGHSRYLASEVYALLRGEVPEVAETEEVAQTEEEN